MLNCRGPEVLYQNPISPPPRGISTAAICSGKNKKGEEKKGERFE
jgi:hypothetical protein